ncbi:fimbrial biogenesis chaperone [Vibrio atypicus]|uniref:fimbrial biogenesis chaperone n=1 Tax=Vibrio atypicus TaxID=558271 RepID=UPI00135B7451|nr:molecular chaperone [Vibrio atypicus]
MKRFSLFILSCIFAVPVFAQLLIAPTRFVLDADRSITEKIVVENSSDQPLRLEIKPVYRPITSAGVTRLTQDIQQTENIANWIQVSPPVIRELKPNQRRTIRLRFNALPKDMTDGEYRAYLWFSPIATGQEQAKDSKQLSGPAFELDFRVNSYIPIYAQRGKVTQNVDIQCQKDAIHIQNNGKYQFNATLNINGQDERLVLLRDSQLIKPVAAKSHATLLQDQKKIHECFF